MPWRRTWQPTPEFLPGESHGQRSLVGYSPRGRREPDTTEQLTLRLPWWLRRWRIRLQCETWLPSLGWEDPLEKEMATRSSVLPWGIPWTEEPGGLQSIGSQRVGHDWATFPFSFFIQWGWSRFLGQVMPSYKHDAKGMFENREQMVISFGGDRCHPQGSMVVSCLFSRVFFLTQMMVHSLPC